MTPAPARRTSPRHSCHPDYASRLRRLCLLAASSGWRQRAGARALRRPGSRRRARGFAAITPNAPRAVPPRARKQPWTPARPPVVPGGSRGGFWSAPYPRTADAAPTPCRSQGRDLDFVFQFSREPVNENQFLMHQSAAFRELYLMVPEAARADKVAKPRFREVSTQRPKGVMGLEGHEALLSAAVGHSMRPSI